MKVSKFKTYKDFINESSETEKVEATESNKEENLDLVEENTDVKKPSEDTPETKTNLENVGEIAENNEVDSDLDIRTDIESDGELDGNTEIENDEAPMMDEPMMDEPVDDIAIPELGYDSYSDDVDYSAIPTPELDGVDTVGGCKIVIINGCEPETPVDAKTDELKEKLACDCEEIYLYQLNIQSPKKVEPRDGMEMIYSKIEEADAVIFACETKKGSLSEELKNVVDRLKAHYTESELRNKVFGAIIVGKEDDKLKNELVLCAINDLGMIVGGDCVYVGTGESADLTTMALCVTNLCNATIGIRGSVAENIPNENVDSEIDTYGSFVDREQSEDPTDLGLPNDLPEEGTEENDDFVEDLKGNLSGIFNSDDDDDDEDEDEDEEDDNEDDDNEIEEEELDAVGKEDSDVNNDGKVDKQDDYIKNKRKKISKEIKTEEEEERLIDNLDGTITHIHNGRKDTNRPKGEVTKEGNAIIGFDEFLKG